MEGNTAMFASRQMPDGRAFFRFNYYDTDQVCVVGSWNDWNPIPLEPTENGWWEGMVGPLERGNYFYKFFTRDGWHFDQLNIRRSLDGETSFLHIGDGCGQLLLNSFFSHSLDTEKKYVVYLPPSYVLDREAFFPTLTLLPGLLDYEMTWARKCELEDLMDRMIGNGAIPEMIVVMPDKDDSMLDESSWEAYRHYIGNDLLSHIEATYRAERSGDARAIEGLSLGGAWALRLACLAPDDYKSVSGLSCAFTDELRALVQASADRLSERRVRFRLACGDGEGEVLFHRTRQFSSFLREHGLSCETTMDSGPHDWPLWRRQLPHSLAFHGWSLSMKE